MYSHNPFYDIVWRMADALTIETGTFQTTHIHYLLINHEISNVKTELSDTLTHIHTTVPKEWYARYFDKSENMRHLFLSPMHVTYIAAYEEIRVYYGIDSSPISVRYQKTKTHQSLNKCKLFLSKQENHKHLPNNSIFFYLKNNQWLCLYKQSKLESNGIKQIKRRNLITNILAISILNEAHENSNVNTMRLNLEKESRLLLISASGYNKAKDDCELKEKREQAFIYDSLNKTASLIPHLKASRQKALKKYKNMKIEIAKLTHEILSGDSKKNFHQTKTLLQKLYAETIMVGQEFYTHYTNKRGYKWIKSDINFFMKNQSKHLSTVMLNFKKKEKITEPSQKTISLNKKETPIHKKKKHKPLTNKHKKIFSRPKGPKNLTFPLKKHEENTLDLNEFHNHKKKKNIRKSCPNFSTLKRAVKNKDVMTILTISVNLGNRIPLTSNQMWSILNQAKTSIKTVDAIVIYCHLIVVFRKALKDYPHDDYLLNFSRRFDFSHQLSTKLNHRRIYQIFLCEAQIYESNLSITTAIKYLGDLPIAFEKKNKIIKNKEMALRLYRQSPDRNLYAIYFTCYPLWKSLYSEKTIVLDKHLQEKREPGELFSLEIGSPQAFFNLANLILAFGKQIGLTNIKEQRKECLIKASSGDISPVCTELGKMYYEEKNYSQAEILYRKALAITQKNAIATEQAYYHLSKITFYKFSQHRDIAYLYESFDWMYKYASVNNIKGKKEFLNLYKLAVLIKTPYYDEKYMLLRSAHKMLDNLNLEKHTQLAVKNMPFFKSHAVLSAQSSTLTDFSHSVPIGFFHQLNQYCGNDIFATCEDFSVALKNNC